MRVSEERMETRIKSFLHANSYANASANSYANSYANASANSYANASANSYAVRRSLYWLNH